MTDKREQTDVIQAICKVLTEFNTASYKFPPFNSAHEGFAVLKEEVDELWDEVKLKKVTKQRLRAEAVQVGAMALRFIIDMEKWDSIPEGEDFTGFDAKQETF